MPPSAEELQRVSEVPKRATDELRGRMKSDEAWIDADASTANRAPEKSAHA
jgi:hypothetical protein